MKLLTNSRAKTARLCAAKHEFSYNLGIKPVEEIETLNFGTAIHRALEVWWSVATSERLDCALAEIEKEKAIDEYARARALVMVTGYHTRWKDEPFVAVAVEPEFFGPLVNPDTGRTSKIFQIAGKLDAIVRNTDDGSVWILEHKTSSDDVSPGSVYHRRLRMDSQVSMYFDGARILGHDNIAGCIYDVLSKPSQRPYKATPTESRKYTAKGALYATQHDVDEPAHEYLERCLEAVVADPSKYYTRLSVPRLDSELQQSRRDLWNLSQRMHFDSTKNYHARNPDACMAWNRVCGFFDICSGVASLDDPRLFRKTENAHEELLNVPPAVKAVTAEREG